MHNEKHGLGGDDPSENVYLEALCHTHSSPCCPSSSYHLILPIFLCLFAGLFFNRFKGPQLVWSHAPIRVIRHCEEHYLRPQPLSSCAQNSRSAPNTSVLSHLKIPLSSTSADRIHSHMQNEYSPFQTVSKLIFSFMLRCQSLLSSLT